MRKEINSNVEKEKLFSVFHGLAQWSGRLGDGSGGEFSEPDDVGDYPLVFRIFY